MGSKTAPDAQSSTVADAGEPALVALIRDEILAAPDRRVTFARFMERALTEPGLGYYATSRTRPTRGGDFLTAPELHPFFGRLVGRHLTDVWTRIGAPSRFTVREYGAGGGTLERTVGNGLSDDRSAIVDALEWQPIDVGIHAPAEVIVGAVVANEYLDALPVHRLVQRAGRLLERYVGWDRERFVTIEDGPSTQRLADVLAADGVELRDDQAAEVSLEAIDWASGLGAELERGVVLVFDYGHEAADLYGARRSAGTLMTYAGHEAGDDPYVRVGSQDITAHVDLTAIDRAARDGGLERVGSTTQARFLASLGLAELLYELGRRPGTPVDDYLLARSAVGRMLDPRHLGGFAVRAWGRGIDVVPPLLGFDTRDPGRPPASRP